MPHRHRGVPVHLKPKPPVFVQKSKINTRLGSDGVDDIKTAHTEVGGGSEEMAIMGIHFGETVLGGAGEMKRIGRAEENGGRGVLEKRSQSLLDGIAQRQPMKQPVL